MIVPMKKVSIVVKSSWVDDTLHALRDVGIVHIQSREQEKEEKDETQEQLIENIHTIEQAFSLVSECSTSEPGDGDGLKHAQDIITTTDTIHKLENEIKGLEHEYERIKEWGEFDPKEIARLKDKGFFIRLYECSEGELNNAPRSVSVQVINNKKNTLLVAAVSTDYRVRPPFKEIPIPERGLLEFETFLKSKKEDLEENKEKLKEAGNYVSVMKKALQQYREHLDYERAKEAAGTHGNVAYLSGFCPDSELEKLTKKAHEQHWGLLIREPSESDPVPTLIKYSKLTRLFQPVMNFIGITPGYREFDTNALFLIFFSIFFAVLIGDAGYGLIILLAAFIAHKRSVIQDRAVVLLFYLTAGATIAWGAMTGVWFGVEALSRAPILKEFVIPSLNSYVSENESSIINLCFLTGAIQLSLAHTWRFIRGFPARVAFADVGWGFIVWAIYFIARFLVMGDPLNPVGLYLLTAGIATVVVFEQQKDDAFIKGVGRGLTQFPLTTLNSISSLSDLVSYVRLFAVGLATKEVAVAFNGIAQGVGFDSIFHIIGAVFILFFGHTVNLLLGAMAVLVHGVRLNLLEFSRHLNIQWSGIPYKPFKGEK